MKLYANLRLKDFIILFLENKYLQIVSGWRETISIIIFLFSSSFLFAQLPIIWTGSVNSDWNNPSNWHTPIVPNSIGFSAIIGDTSNDPVINSSVTIHNIIINTGGELTVESDGVLDLSAVLPSSLTGILVNFGTVENLGDINITTGDPSIYQYALYNTGEFENYENVDIASSNSGGFYNSGTFVNRGGNFSIGSTGSIPNNGIFIEDGSVTNQNFLGALGSLDIDRTTNDAIAIGTDGLFHLSSGTVTIGGDLIVDKYGIDNSGGFLGTGGTINIIRSGWSGIKNRDGAEFENISSTFNIGTVVCGGHGINNSGSFENRKTINIYRADLNGVLNTDSGNITNTANGKINIGTSATVVENGIDNSGTITNNKTIDIRRAGNNGILNASSGVITNASGSSLLIGTTDAVGNYGVRNDGAITNTNGTFTIKACENTSLYIDNGGSVDNQSGSTLNIGTSGGSIGQAGIYIRLSTLTNNASIINIENTGTISASDGEGMYIDLLSTIENENGATLNIGQNSGLIKKEGIYLTGASNFVNNNSSSIVIDNTDQSAIVNEQGLWFTNSNNSTIEIGQNNGDIGGEGIYNTTFFENIGGTIEIDKVTGSGIRNLNDGILNNKNGGLINIGLNGGAGSIGFYGIENDNTFFNSGDTRIANTQLDGIHNLSTGVLDNLEGGQIYIGVDGGLMNIGRHGISSDFEISNEYGSIHIDNTSNHGIQILSSGSLYNNAELAIGLAGASSIGQDGIFNSNSIINDGGNVQIENAIQDGIQCDGGSFENNNLGEVIISNTQAHGIRTGFGSEFINNSTVSISNIEKETVLFSSTSGSYASFVNDNGILNIDGKISPFLHMDGVLSPGIDGPGEIYTGSSSFTWLHSTTLDIDINGSTPITEHDIFSINPDGIIELGTDDDSASLSHNINYTPQIEGRFVFMTAGTINGTFGTITPALPDNWSLDYTVPGEVALKYSYPRIRDWFGSIDSDWNNAGNWSPAIVPTAIDIVNITNNGFDPIIEASENIEISELNILAGAILTNDGGNLSIINSDHVALSVLGTLNNHGVIEIDDSGTHAIRTYSGATVNNYNMINLGQNGNTNSIFGVGIWNDATFTNEVGEINIDFTGSLGIYNNGGVFTNRANINVGSNGSIGGEGIQNKSNFSNENGDINIDRTNSIGFLNSIGTFSNGAILNIGQNIGISSTGFSNSAGIENFDQINIDNTEEHALEHITGDFTNEGEINIGQDNLSGIGGNGIEVEGDFVNLNTINIDHTGGASIRIFEQNALFSNLGNLNLGLNTGILASTGILVESSAEFYNFATGFIELKDLYSGIKTNASGDVFTNDGDIYFDNYNNYAIESLGEFINSGLLAGNGKILFSDQELGGTISPGYSPGSFYFESNLEGNVETVMTIEVEGTSEATYDYVDNLETIDVSNITLDLHINYIPEAGDEIVFLSASEIIGTFSELVEDLPEGWEIIYNANNVALKYSIVLPVDLISFKAQTTGQKVHLDWATSIEINNSGFEIWHSNNSNDWRLIGFVEGSGNSTNYNEYQFQHLEPESGDNYYRLKQIDYDGQFAFSEIRVANINQDQRDFKIVVYPNPTTDYAFVSLSKDHLVESIWVTNDNGKIVYKTNVAENKEQISLDLKTWPSGMYVIYMQIDSQVISNKLIYLGPQ